MKVSLVGAGPGDPGLLTIKGRELLEAADVIVYDALACPDLLNFAPAAKKIYVGKIADNHALPQEEINELLVRLAQENGGQNIVRLKGGDPYIFGRGGEEAEYLANHNIPFEEVPGISSAIAAPAYAGIPLTHRGHVSSLSIITGHENPKKTASSHNWKALAASGSTLVFLMGMKNLEHIAANLVAAGLHPLTPAAIIYRGATPMQRVLEAPLADLPARAKEEKFENPSVIVIGQVVSLRTTLDWFSKKPLLGRTIVVTRAREQASEMVRNLAEMGARVLECPAIEVCGLTNYARADEAIKNLRGYNWLIFTSANGIKYFWERLAQAGLDSRAFSGIKIAAIGPATAQALLQKGILADFVPTAYVAEKVASDLLAREDLAGQKILLPRAAIARDVLPTELERAGALVDVVPVYETRKAATNVEEVIRLLEADRLDCVTFGSSSTVENFLDILPEGLLQAHPSVVLAAIGPITASTLLKHGLQADIQPQQYTMPALAAAIANHFVGNVREEN